MCGAPVRLHDSAAHTPAHAHTRVRQCTYVIHAVRCRPGKSGYRERSYVTHTRVRTHGARCYVTAECGAVRSPAAAVAVVAAIVIRHTIPQYIRTTESTHCGVDTRWSYLRGWEVYLPGSVRI